MNITKYLFLGALLCSSIGCSSARAAELQIAVASNFISTLKPLIKAFEASYPHTIKSSSGSTGQLFAQIAHGAPFDIFLAADSYYPQQLENRGLGVQGTRVTYAIGKLVLWSNQPQSKPLLNRLKRGAFSHLAIANPYTAPYGVAARQSLENLQLWEKLQDKIIKGNNAGQAFQFVASGNADMGLVALAQVRVWQEQHNRADTAKNNRLWAIPQALYQPITQQAILLTHGEDNPAAVTFLHFLQTPQAQTIIRRAGYEVSP